MYAVVPREKLGGSNGMLRTPAVRVPPTHTSTLVQNFVAKREFSNNLNQVAL